MTRVFVVTGSNKGIGYAIVKTLAESKALNGKAVIYLTARNVSLGEGALAKLKSEANGKLLAEIKFHQLDITNEESCKKFAAYLKSTHGGLDVLVNNAGIATPDKVSIGKQAEDTMEINYYGTKRITETLLPLIRPNGRIVILASLMGIVDGTGYHQKFNLGAYSKEIRHTFDNNTFTIQDVDHFVDEFIRLSKEEEKSGQPLRRQGGYIENAYSVSKASDIAYTMALSRAVKDKNITVYGCCPGWVATDLNAHSGPLTTDQGADTPSYLALAEGLQNGKFYSQREVEPWPETNYAQSKVIG